MGTSRTEKIKYSELDIARALKWTSIVQCKRINFLADRGKKLYNFRHDSTRPAVIYKKIFMPKLRHYAKIWNKL